MKTVMGKKMVFTAIAALALGVGVAEGIQSTPESSLIGTWEGLVDFSYDSAFDLTFYVYREMYTIDSLVVGQQAGSVKIPTSEPTVTGPLILSRIDSDTSWVFDMKRGGTNGRMDGEH